MVEVELESKQGIAILRPYGVLSRNDFAATARVIDPYIRRHGKLNGLMIHTETFPGWEHFAALLAHIKFVQGHHKLISHVAIVTDSPMGKLAEQLASHFVAAEIRYFPYIELEKAKKWIADSK